MILHAMCAESVRKTEKRRMVKERKATGIKTWPEDDRPREKLLKKEKGGFEKYRASGHSFFAPALPQGTSAIDLARKILKKFGTFRDMAHNESRDWKRSQGACGGASDRPYSGRVLKSGGAIDRTMCPPGSRNITSAKDVVDIVMPQLRDLKTEVFKVVCLDSSNVIIDITDAASGTVNRVMPIVREIIHQSARQTWEVSIICLHNHPSGDPKPSKEDRDFEGNFAKQGVSCGVKILDASHYWG